MADYLDYAPQIMTTTTDYVPPKKYCARKHGFCTNATNNGFCQLTACNKEGEGEQDG